MTDFPKPDLRPANPDFSSGPCAKRPGWSPDVLANAPLGRSHRAGIGRDRLARAIGLTRKVLRVPDDYRIGIVPASDTGAVEMAMWSLLGERGVDMLAWESFGAGWVADAVGQLELDDVRAFEAPYGRLPDLARIDFDRDVVFTWNGTTSGVRVPNGGFIPADRRGLTICDATSAAFAQALDFAKLDVVTFSWQKALGGEGGHGVLVLSPRAVARLESYAPPRPLPKIFRLTAGGRLIEGIFAGETINTPSMLCVEDYLDALAWADSIGGLDALIARADANAAVIGRFVAENAWLDHLAADPKTRSNTSVCLSIADPRVTALDPAGRKTFAASIATALDDEGAAHDIGAYRDAPAGLRIWCGATVEKSDLEALTPWLAWAFHTRVSALAQAA